MIRICRYDRDFWEYRYVIDYQKWRTDNPNVLYFPLYCKKNRPTKDKIKDEYLTKWVVML